jgi:hypothetical protein
MHYVSVSVTEPKLFLSTNPNFGSGSSLGSRQFYKIRTLKMSFFDLNNKIKIVTIYKTIFRNHDFFLENFFKSVVNRNEP